jgi:hypothetical protein
MSRSFKPGHRQSPNETAGAAQLRTEGERLSPEASLSPESPRAEALSAEAGSFEPRPEQLRPKPLACRDSTPSGASELGRLSEHARELLADIPADREGKSEWLKRVARDEEITLDLARQLRLPVAALDQRFPCVLHASCFATLTRGRNREIVYHDSTRAPRTREFQTVVELAVAIMTATQPRRLRPLQIALWRLRMLYEAGLIELPPASVPDVSAGSPPCVHRARAGFELLIRCRWFLDPGEPVTYTRSFVELWCGIPTQQARRAVFELLRQGVIVKVGAIPSGYPRPAHLYQPGPPTIVETHGGFEQ